MLHQEETVEYVVSLETEGVRDVEDVAEERELTEEDVGAAADEVELVEVESNTATEEDELEEADVTSSDRIFFICAA